MVSQLSEIDHQNYTHSRWFQENKLSQEIIDILSTKQNNCSILFKENSNSALKEFYLI